MATTPVTNVTRVDSQDQTVMDALKISQDILKSLSILQNQFKEKITNINQIPDITKIKRIHESIHNAEQFSHSKSISCTCYNIILNRQYLKYSQFITSNLDSYLISLVMAVDDDIQSIKSHPPITATTSTQSHPSNARYSCPPPFSIDTVTTIYPVEGKQNEYEYDYSDEDDDTDHNLSQIMDDISEILMMHWPFHIHIKDIDTEYQQTLNKKFNVSTEQITRYISLQNQSFLGNYWIINHMESLRVDPAQYLQNINLDAKSKQIIQKKFINIMNSLYPNGIFSKQIGALFEYFMGFVATKQQIEYATDLCDKTIDILQLRAMYKINSNENKKSMMQTVLSYEEMMACVLYDGVNGNPYDHYSSSKDGIDINTLQKNLNKYFQITLDINNPYCQYLLHELVDPVVFKRCNTYLLGWKSRNRLNEMLTWWNRNKIHEIKPKIATNSDNNVDYKYPLMSHNNNSNNYGRSNRQPRYPTIQRFTSQSSVVIRGFDYNTIVIDFIYWVEHQYGVKVENQSNITYSSRPFFMVLTLQNEGMAQSLLKLKYIQYLGVLLQVDKAKPSAVLK